MDNLNESQILVVDDAEENIDIIIEALGNDYEISVAMDGETALQAVAEKKPDLILLDIIMPGMDGYGVCTRLKESEDYRDISIIFLTSKIETEDVVKGFSLGAADYITKPFNLPILRARVKTHLTLMRHIRQLEEFASKDGLTMVANRRIFNDFLDREWRRCQRSHLPISLLMIDIDHFKIFNDTYGHLQGDDVLKRVAATIDSSCLRPGDLVARYGGEEFAVVMGTTDNCSAYRIAEEVRRKIELLQIQHAGSEKHFVTISIGVATLVPERKSAPEKLIELADSFLYKAKGAGRNQVKSS